MWLIAIILSLLLATTARATGPEGPDGAMLAQAAKSVVQVISTDCTGEDDVERSGSGFVLAKSGLIVTDLHVVAGCTTYQVRYQNSGEESATLVHVLKARDLALLKVDELPAGLQIPGLQTSIATPQAADKLYVIGYPLGLGAYDSAPLTVGLATRTTPELKYALDAQALNELIAAGSPSTDTLEVRVTGSLDPGDSGAPLIDYQGNVAGIGDGGLQRGTVGIGWATQPQYVDQLVKSNEPLSVASLGIASVDFAVTIPKTKAEEADNKVQCGALSLVRSRDVHLGSLIKTTDDPVKLRKLAQDLIGTPIDQFDNDKFAIWTEPESGAGIALPKELRIEAGPDHCSVHTGAPDIDYIIAIASLPFNPTTPEWEVAANRQAWLAGHRALLVADTHQLLSDQKHTVPRRFENGGMIVRRMATGQSNDGKPVRVFSNDLSGRGAFVSISVVNRDAKADPAEMTAAERLAWARGLLAVNLTALPPVQEKVAPTAQSSAADATEAADMVWPGPRRYPRLRCGDAGLILLSQPRMLGGLIGSADLDTVLRAVAGIPSTQIAQDQFDVWVQPLKGAVVLLPHGIKPAADQQTCRIASPAAPIGFALRVVKPNKDLPRPEWQRQADTAIQAFSDSLVQAAGGSLHPDPAGFFRAKIDPNGLVEGRLLIATRPDGGRALIYLASLRRDQNLTLFATTDYDVKPSASLAPADRAALAQALAAVRLSTLLPPHGFLTTQESAQSPVTAQSADH